MIPHEVTIHWAKSWPWPSLQGPRVRSPQLRTGRPLLFPGPGLMLGPGLHAASRPLPTHTSPSSTARACPASLAPTPNCAHPQSLAQLVLPVLRASCGGHLLGSSLPPCRVLDEAGLLGTPLRHCSQLTHAPPPAFPPPLGLPSGPPAPLGSLRQAWGGSNPLLGAGCLLNR